MDEGGDSPLCHAARGGDAKTVRRLLDLGADPNFGTYTLPLIEAAGHGHLAVVEALLAAGAKPNAVDETGATALHNAAAGGHTGVVHALVLGDADAGRTDPQGHVPAEYAAERGHRELGFFLLSQTPVRKRERALRMLNGQDPDPVLTPEEQLLRAVKDGDVEKARRLIEGGADINAKEDQAVTALEIAANRGHLKLVKLLVEAGADVNHVDGYNGTALDFARMGHRKKVVDFLYPLTKPELGERKPARRVEYDSDQDIGGQ